MSNYCKNCYELTEQLDQLKAENDELKKQVCGLRPELKYIIDKTCCKYNINAKYYHEKIVEIINNLDQLKAENEELRNNLSESLMFKFASQDNEIQKLKQTLTEIKEIASPYNDMSGNCVIVNCFEDMYKILQKISEVIPDEKA